MRKPTPVAAAALRSIVIFSGVCVEECEMIAKGCKGHQVETGEEIISYRDETDDVYFVVSGEVRVTIFTHSGKRVSFRDIDTGHVVGEWSAIDGHPRSSSVVALSETFMISMSAAMFKRIITDNPPVAWKLLQEVTLLARRLSARIVDYSALSVTGRLHVELLRLARVTQESTGVAVQSLFATNEELASRISTRREAVSRELRRLEKMGIVGREGNKRMVRDVEKLESLVRKASATNWCEFPQ